MDGMPGPSEEDTLDWSGGEEVGWVGGGLLSPGGGGVTVGLGLVVVVVVTSAGPVGKVRWTDLLREWLADWLAG